jgi:hypothetical protein
MRRFLIALAAIAATIAIPAVAAHATPCAPGACITISGTVTGPDGEAVPSYTVQVQRADGYSAQAVTAANGVYSVDVPIPASASQCYQIVGVADSFYANSTTGVKMCAAGTANLNPRVRTQSFVGQQKNYLADSSKDVVVPIEVEALSRTYPATFAGERMAYTFGFDDPWGSTVTGRDPDVGEETEGIFAAPAVRQIAAGVWQYTWDTSVTLEGGNPGYYDVDWGRRADAESAFDPMMECRMYWFGFGTDSISQSKALPGQIVTLHGQRLGSVPGAIKFKGSGQVTIVSGTGIVSWSDTSVTFQIPVNAKSGWVDAVMPSGIETNAQYIDLDPAKTLP